MGRNKNHAVGRVENALFGFSVSISGDHAVVGAHGTDTGNAYVFERQMNGAWVGTKLNALEIQSGDMFGLGVSISGGKIVVGAYGDDENASNSGAAYIFERNSSGQWVQTAKLKPSAPEENSEFGKAAVSISGTNAIIGAPSDADQTKPGSAYIFEQQSDGTWLENVLAGSQLEAGARFGGSADILDNRAIVGASNDDDRGNASGSAFIYERQADGRWQEITKLTAADGAPEDYFGVSVSIFSQKAVVGSYYDDPNGVNSGSAYLFEQQPTDEWRQVKLTASNGAQDDWFGISVALSGETAIVGAFGSDIGGNAIGAAYVFEDLSRCHAEGDQAGQCRCIPEASGADCSARVACADGTVEHAVGGRSDIVFCANFDDQLMPVRDEAPSLCGTGWHLCNATEWFARNDNCGGYSFSAWLDQGDDCRVVQGVQQLLTTAMPIRYDQDIVGPAQVRQSGEPWSGHNGNGEILECDMSFCGSMCCKD